MKRSQIKCTFGINESGVPIHISQVPSGKTKLSCPSCSTLLIAAKGDLRQHHFKHKRLVECIGGLESTMHKVAKYLITQKKSITLPKYEYTIEKNDSMGFKHVEKGFYGKEGLIVHFESATEEVYLNGIRADVVANSNNRPLIIEFNFSHRVDGEKVKKIKEQNISAIEIDISDFTQNDVDDLESFWNYINDTKRINWLYNDKYEGMTDPGLYEQLELKVVKQEERYKECKKKELKYLAVLKYFRSKEYSEKLQRDYKRVKYNKPPYYWKESRKYLPYEWGNLPEFLNKSVPDGDWIMSVGRFAWQTAVYSRYVSKCQDDFYLRDVIIFLSSIAGLGCNRIVSLYSGKNKRLIVSESMRAEIENNEPSVERTLISYLSYLEELGIIRRWVSTDEIDSWEGPKYSVVRKYLPAVE